MNKITLVRLDGDAKHEVDIPVGETVIGRGPVMQCTDKRVSRTHAQIKVSEDGKIELTSTSLNPCYYDDDKVIKKSSSVELRIGDRFSFLPDSYCYCVKAGKPNGSASEEAACSSDIMNKNGDIEEKPFKTEETGVQSVNPDAVPAIKVTPADEETGREVSAALASAESIADLSGEMTDPDVPSDGEKNGSAAAPPVSAIKRLPKWLLSATERSERSGEEPSGGEPGTEKGNTGNVALGVEAAEEKSPAKDSDGNSERGRRGGGVAAPASAAHRMSDDSESEEPVGEKPPERAAGQRQSPTRPSTDTERASESLEEEEKKRSGEGEGAVAAADSGRSRSPVSTSSRDSCKYGSGCYRKNPQHRAEFSHPGDDDYKPDDRPECPYGTDCYRKNPLHKQNYRHTKKPEKPPKKRQRVKKADAKGGNENSDEDDYDYDDPFLNDASSDDYEPTDSGSDVSASEGEEEEDTKRMKKEAKRFVRGKRKH